MVISDITESLDARERENKQESFATSDQMLSMTLEINRGYELYLLRVTDALSLDTRSQSVDNRSAFQALSCNVIDVRFLLEQLHADGRTAASFLYEKK